MYASSTSAPPNDFERALCLKKSTKNTATVTKVTAPNGIKTTIRIWYRFSSGGSSSTEVGVFVEDSVTTVVTEIPVVPVESEVEGESVGIVESVE